MKIRITSEEQEELVEQNLNLVDRIVKKLEIVPSDYDYVLSTGRMALFKAALAFDSSNGIEFSSYASECINNEISGYLKTKKACKGDVFLNKPITNFAKEGERKMNEKTSSPDQNFAEETAQKNIDTKCVNEAGSNLYQLSFATRDVENFNKIFANILEGLTSTKDLPNFKVNSNKERVIIKISAHPQSFSFIAKIIREMNDFSMMFVSN